MKIGIIGIGIVGGAMAKVLSRIHKIYTYDKFKKEYSSEKNIKELAANSELVFICVPTPMKPNSEMDSSAIYDCLAILSSSIKKTKRNPEDILVVIKSTIVPGTTDKLAEKYPFDFAFNPEFLREKHALEDMEKTDRVIIGTNDSKDKNKLIAVYKPLFKKANYVFADRKTAEMIKYAANVFLASQVGIANEIYNICEAAGIDYDNVKKAVLLDKRIARNIDVPGPDNDFGFGGMCFPKDLNALICFAKQNNYNPSLLEEVWNLNNRVRKNKDWLK